MAELSQFEFEQAQRSGQDYAITQPMARQVRFDRANARIVVELTNGCVFAFPPQLVEGLQDATPDQLAQVETASGYGLHWEELDVDMTVAGLMNGIFGTRKWMAAQAGRRTSPAKAAAARANGLKGGRPKKKA